MARIAAAASLLLLLLTASGGATASTPPAPHGTGVHPARTGRHGLPTPVLKQLALHAKRGAVPAGKRAPVQRGKGFPPTGHMGADLPGDLTTAIEATGQSFAGAASFVTAPLVGTPDAIASSLAPTLTAPGFPTDGSDFAVLTTGDANLAGTPNTAGNTGTDDSCTVEPGCGPDGDPTSKGANRGNAHDVTILKIPLTVPKGQTCLSFDFRFLSDEYPEWVGTPFNDSFIAELDKNTWTATGASVLNPVSAPANFAFDPAGHPVSINAIGTSTMSPGGSFDTTYDGGTPMLRAQTPITAGAHTLYLSIFDQGDHVYDSAAFVDNLALSAAKCSSGSFVDEQPADLSLTKSGTPGDTGIDYSLTVTNGGPATAENVTVDDPLPNGLSYSNSETSKGSCSDNDGDIRCDLGELAPGQEVDIGISADGDPAVYSNTATVYSTTFDPILGNNTATSTDTIGDGGVEHADLALTKIGPDSMTQGNIVDYQMTVTNNGPGDLTNGIEIADQFPSGLTFTGCLWNDGNSAAPLQWDGCTLSDDGKTVWADVEPGFVLANGASIEISLLAYVTATGVVQNKASVYAWSGNDDPDNTNDKSTTTMNVDATSLPTGDVAVTKTVDSLYAPVGGGLTYTITATNKSSRELKSVRVYDLPDTGTTDVGVSDSLGQCTSLAVDGGFDCNVDLLAGKSDKITYHVTVSNTAGQYVDNFAQSFPAGYYDPNFNNNSATAFTKVGDGTGQIADLTTTASGPASTGVGGVVNTTFKVANVGPNAVNDVEFDFYSAALNVGGTLVSAPGCDLDTWTCDIGTMAKGATKTFVITWITPPFPGTGFVTGDAFSNDATWVDPNGENNFDYAETDVVQAQSDIELDMSDVDPILNGGTETWSLKVTNHGPDPATSVQVVDGLPGEAVLHSATGTNWGCAGLVSVICTLKSPLKSGAAATVTIVATVSVDTPPGSITNIASASTASNDTNLANNSDVEETTVNPPNADLAIVDKESPNPVLVGTKLTHTLTITNNGPLTAPAPTVTDDLPDGETLVSVTGAKCTGSGTLTCPLADLKPKTSVKITIVVTASPDSPPVSLMNDASVASALLDVDPGNNEDDEAAQVNPPYADVALTGRATPALVAQGGTITYTFTLKNLGPQATTGIDFQETLPDAVIVPANAPAGCSFAGQILNCAGGILKPGASKAIAVAVKAPSTPGTTLTSNATAAIAPTDPNAVNNTASATSMTKP